MADEGLWRIDPSQNVGMGRLCDSVDLQIDRVKGVGCVIRVLLWHSDVYSSTIPSLTMDI